MRYIYSDSILMSANKVIGIIWHSRAHLLLVHMWQLKIVISCFFVLVFAVMVGLYVDYRISASGHLCAMWQAYLFRSICQ